MLNPAELVVDGKTYVAEEALIVLDCVRCVLFEGHGGCDNSRKCTPSLRKDGKHVIWLKKIA